jgi:FtsZ-binding cell division protein ZapB
MQTIAGEEKDIWLEQFEVLVKTSTEYEIMCNELEEKIEELELEVENLKVEVDLLQQENEDLEDDNNNLNILIKHLVGKKEQ